MIFFAKRARQSKFNPGVRRCSLEVNRTLAIDEIFLQGERARRGDDKKGTRKKIEEPINVKKSRSVCIEYLEIVGTFGSYFIIPRYIIDLDLETQIPK